MILVSETRIPGNTNHCDIGTFFLEKKVPVTGRIATSNKIYGLKLQTAHSSATKQAAVILLQRAKWTLGKPGIVWELHHPDLNQIKLAFYWSSWIRGALFHTFLEISK